MAYKILVVDDERIERNGIKFLLKQLNIQIDISESANGQDALRKVKENDYDILLTDVRMPFMDGIELIENVDKINKEIKVVIFSGCNEFDYAKKAIKLGVEDYILKPVDPKEFEATILKVISELEEARIERDMKERNLEFLKEHALYMLLNGSELEKVCDHYKDIDMQSYLSKYNRVALLEFSQEFFGKYDLEISDFSVAEFIPERKYLNLNQQQSVIFFNDEKKKYIDTAKMLWEELSQKYEEKCYIAVSMPIESPADIPNKMDELETLMENRFYHPEVHVFCEEMGKNPDNIINVDDDTLMKQMKQDIKMKDMESLNQHFDRFCGKFVRKNEYSQIYIKFLFSNLLKDIYSNLDGSSDNMLNKEIEKLYLLSDFVSVSQVVRDAIKKLEEKYESINNQGHREVEVIKHYIYNNYGKEISIDMLADMVYMAPSYLSTVFKKETGQNLSKFIKACRMEMAKQMLNDSMAKIVDISNQCGYPNVSYFCSSFREYYGVSPQKFRENGSEVSDEERQI